MAPGAGTSGLERGKHGGGGGGRRGAHACWWSGSREARVEDTCPGLALVTSVLPQALRLQFPLPPSSPHSSEVLSGLTLMGLETGGPITLQTPHL